MDRIVLIDAYGHIYRNFYGLHALTDAQGMPANALFAIVRFLISIEESLPGRYGAVVYDKGKCTRRCSILPEYKAQRPPMPDNLRCQLEKIRQVFLAFGWPILEEEGREADDIMAAVAVADTGLPVDVMSYDKDLAQLVDGRVQILTPGKKGDWERMNIDGVREKYGIEPGQLRDYLALIGDSADNIPGVSGIGPVTAVKLLKKYGSIDGILEAIPQMPSNALRQKLEDALAKDIFNKNRALVALDTELPVGWNGLAGLEKHTPDWAKIRQLCVEWGFKSIVETLDKKHGTKNEPEQLMLF